MLHLLALHQNASNNPIGIASTMDRIRFHPYFISKDLVGFLVAGLIFSIFIFFYPNYLGHPDNSIPANS
jgi:quinol-cytochrome oxidoreductase complex cytochrome b subunit